MCLIVPRDQQPVVLTEDMTVYKMVRVRSVRPVTRPVTRGRGGSRRILNAKPSEEGPVTVHAFFENFQYVLGEEYKTEILAVDDDCCFDNVDDEYLLRTYGKRSKWKGTLTSYGPGFHSVVSPGLRVSSAFVVECTIPAGSKIFTEPTGCIVSDRIVVNKIIQHHQDK